MIAGLALYALIVGVLIAAAARCLEELVRLASLPLRWVWLVALVALVALTALAPLRTPTDGAVALPMDVRAFAVGETEAPGVIAGSGSTTGSLLDQVRTRATAPVEASLAAVAGAARWTDRVVVGLWIGSSLAVLLAFLSTARRWAVRRRGWRPGVMAGRRVRVSPGSGPAVVGVVRPEIVVPRWLTSASPEEQQLVMLHEGEHLVARDPAVLALGCLAVALMPWHPAAWWMLFRLRLAVELDCDRRVLARGIRPFAYGSVLIDIAGRTSGVSLGAPALADTPATLERRIVAMTSPFTRFRTVRAIALALPAVLLVLVACDAELPTTAEVEAMDVAAVEAQAERLRFIARADGESITYFLNGNEVTADEARSILGDDIARMEVLRPGEHGYTQIRILTREGEGDEALRMGLRAGDGEDGRQVRILRRHDVEGDAGEVRTEARAERELRMYRSSDGTAAVTVRGASSLSAGSFDGIIEIDGERVDGAAFRNLRPDQIERIEVVKGEAATRLYDDPAARNGVIRITTRDGTVR